MPGISDSRQTQGFTVIAFSIIGTETVVLEALEPGREQTHSTITTRDGVRFGYVTSRVLPDAVAALPFGEERIVQVGSFHRGLDAIASEAIRAAYPELAAERELRFTGGHATCSKAAFETLTTVAS